MGDQEENLGRVSARIGAAICGWYALRIERGILEFHVEELREYVTLAVGVVAPGSPDRVMRDLRQKGRINYRVLSRSESWYKIETGNGERVEIEMEE